MMITDSAGNDTSVGQGARISASETSSANWLKRIIVLLSAMALVAASLCAAAPAEAATRYGTVRATTQKMAGPYLPPNYAQSGTYPVGRRLALKCHLWGQQVTGWGGTSNLWYQISDNYFAADVDLDTGSNNPVTAACPNITVNAFVSQTRGKQWANASGTYSGECVSLVSQYLLRVHGIKSGGWGNAVDYRSGGSGGNQLRARGFTWSTNQSFRNGDILVWQSNSASRIGSVGHIAIWHNGAVYDQNDARHSPARSANYSSPFFAGGYLGYWRK